MFDPAAYQAFRAAHPDWDLPPIVSASIALVNGVLDPEGRESRRAVLVSFDSEGFQARTLYADGDDPEFDGDARTRRYAWADEGEIWRFADV